jgi:hypothetical protein
MNGGLDYDVVWVIFYVKGFVRVVSFLVQRLEG